MGLKDVLVKLRLVEVEGGTAPAAAGDPPELAALLSKLPPPAPIDERKLAAAAPRPAPRAGASAAATAGAGAPAATAEPAPGDPLVELPPFEAIYRAAGIESPKHGFTAEKVLEMLASPELAALDGKARAAALAAFLKMNPAGAVPITDIVEDAVRRDQALDQFERFLQSKLAERAAAADRDNARLQAEIDELVRVNREKMDAHRRAIDAARERFETWRAAKQAEERRLAQAVEPFVEGSPITTGD
jgi:hypothetical protein